MSERKGKLTPSIIGMADSTHYLVGMIDANNNFFAFNNNKEQSVVNSLYQAKQLLASHNIFSAELEYQSSYDEMCGSAFNDSYKQTINF